MKKVFTILCIVTFLAIDCSAFSFMQQCPSVNAISNFSVAKYTGKWFEIYRGPLVFTLYEAFLRCVQAEYNVTDTHNVQVKNGGYFIGTSYFYQMIGNAYIGDLSQPGKLEVSFNSIFNKISSSSNSPNYIVLDTDYTNYSLVYSCSTTFYGLIKNEVAWILSRTRTLNQTTVDRLFAKIKAISTTLANGVKISDQKNCPA